MRRASTVICGVALLLGACKPTPEPPPASDANTQPEPPATPLKTPAAARACAEFDSAALERVFARLDPPPDPAELAKLLADPPQPSALDWVASADRRLGRVSGDQPQDLALIKELLAAMPARDQAARAADLTTITTQLRAVALLDMRRLLADVADDRLRGPAATDAWDQAHCIWTASLRSLAARADALPAAGPGRQAWAPAIDEAFSHGRAQLGDPAGAATLEAAKQQIEKGMYAVAYQLILAQAATHTAVGASEALGLIDALEDRLADRNGPGLKRMRMQLNGPPEQIDAAQIERELAVAFAKRARKYCDKAVANGELGTAQAIAETWEGIIYTRVILASMAAALGPEGFDADAHSADWDDYLGAVEANDAELAGELSARLVEWNCAYQRHLRIAECTASANELE